MSTPTRVYHYYSNGMSQPAGGLSTVALTISLARACLSGNCLVLTVAYENGKTITSITDNLGQSWTTALAAIVTSDGGASNVKLSCIVRPNNTAGVQAITINFSAAVHAAAFCHEYYNIATSSPIAQSKTATPTGNTVATAAFSSSPTSGNLIFHVGIANPGSVGAQTANPATGFTAGTGFTLLACSRHVETMNPFAVQERLADGNALTPSMTITQASHDAFCTIALDLTSATSGTAPAAGIRILKTQFFVGPIATNTSWTENFPYEGDLIVMRSTQDATTTLNTDSASNSWRWDQPTAGLPIFQSVRPASPSSTYSVTFKSASINNNTYLFEDISGSAAEVGAVATATGTTGTTDTEITSAPSITPLYKNSLILVSTPIGHGPLTDLHSPTPAAAIFCCPLYPEETDFDTLANADGYANYLNGASLSAAAFAWRWNVDPGGTSWHVGTIESWQAAAVEYPSAPTVALTGTATASIAETDIVAGGKTIILTVTNDTVIPA